MHLNGFLHPDPASIIHHPEKDFDSLYLGSQEVPMDLIAGLSEKNIT